MNPSCYAWRVPTCDLKSLQLVSSERPYVTLYLPRTSIVNPQPPALPPSQQLAAEHVHNFCTWSAMGLVAVKMLADLSFPLLSGSLCHRAGNLVGIQIRSEGKISLQQNSKWSAASPQPQALCCPPPARCDIVRAIPSQDLGNSEPPNRIPRSSVP